MKRTLVGLALNSIMFATVVALGSSQDGGLRGASKSKYKVGQKWSYQTRAGEEKSYFIVVKIESHPKLGTIIHIAMRGLKMKNPHSPDGIGENVDHMPFSEESINRSALKLLKEKTELPNFEEGYQMWREAFDAGHAGIYTITVAEAVKVMEASLNQ